ncbi:MAG: hypothetical protein ACR2KK_22590 [Acidimicrobiales bacterium]
MKRRLRVLAALTVVAFLLLAAPLVASSFGPNGSSGPSITQSEGGLSAGLGTGGSSPVEGVDASTLGTGPEGNESGVVGLPAGATGAEDQTIDPVAAGLKP